MHADHHHCGCQPALVRIAKQQRGGKVYTRPTLDDVTSDPAYAYLQRAWQKYVDALRIGPTLASGQDIGNYIDALPWDDADRLFLELWRKGAFGVLERRFKDEALDGSLRDVLDPERTPDGKLPANMFDLDNPYATRWAREKTATLVREVLKPTKDAIRETIARGFTENKTVAQLGRLIGGYKDRNGEQHNGIVGLLSRDQQAVSLMFDRLVHEDGVKPEEAMIQSSIYADQLLRNRAMNIARTEVKDAQESGKAVAWKTARSSGLLLPETVKKWITGGNDRTCDPCWDLDGEEVDIDEDFPGGVDMPPLHPSCCCTGVLVTHIKR